MAGHTAAGYLRAWLNKSHEVVVVAPGPDYNWVPSNIWLGPGGDAGAAGRFSAGSGVP